MIKLIVLPSLLLITSCELVDYKMPEIPEHEKDGAEEDIQAETTVTKVPKEITHPVTIIKSSQDPEKDFNGVMHSITEGKAKHPFPRDR
tara:strand:+ start:218 stop:484 length:267 start_codon:yes stop_codon:yes gene_type:complete